MESTQIRPHCHLEGQDLNKRKVVRVPEWKASPLRIGADAGRLGEDGYSIEKIGEPFTDKNGRQMVRVTLVERPTQ